MEGDQQMNTPETKLTVETTDGAYQADPSLSFNNPNREVFRITHDGRMIKGEGLSTEEATQEAAKLLIASFEKEIQEMVDNRFAAEREQVRVLRDALELITNQADACQGFCDTFTPSSRIKARVALHVTKEASK
jgi:signal transduction protein with GAF and PtsI domain